MILFGREGIVNQNRTDLFFAFHSCRLHFCEQLGLLISDVSGRTDTSTPGSFTQYRISDESGKASESLHASARICCLGLG